MTLYERVRAKIRSRWRRFRGYCDFPQEPWGNKLDRIFKESFQSMMLNDLYAESPIMRRLRERDD